MYSNGSRQNQGQKFFQKTFQIFAYYKTKFDILFLI